MSIHKTHLVVESLINTSDKILNVAKSGPDGDRCFSKTKPRIDLDLLLAFFISDEIKIEVGMLEITNELPAGFFDFDDLSVDLDANTVRDVHCFRGVDGFHLLIRWESHTLYDVYVFCSTLFEAKTNLTLLFI
jgi:hypothetical protein